MAEPTGATTPERNRRPWVVPVAVGAGVVLILGGFLVYWFVLRSGTMTVRGTVAIEGTRDSGRYAVSTPAKGGPAGCTGADGFADVSGGAAIVITDATGHKVAAGTLNPGLFIASLRSCFFGFVLDVPDDLDTYGVTVGVHGTVLVSRADLQRGAALTLGGP